jgi:hypothetical protein
MAVVQLPDGRVLFLGGGLHDMGDERAEVDAYDPRTGTVGSFPKLVRARILPGAAALADGHVVVAGGSSRVDDDGKSIEIYDPATRAWRLLKGVLKESVISPFVIAMKDGRVLLGGGNVLLGRGYRPLDVFIVDVATGKVTAASPLPWPLEATGFYRVEDDGVINVTGRGPDADDLARDCFASFDPARGAWTDENRCWDAPTDVTRYHDARGGDASIGYGQNGLMARAGRTAWMELTHVPYKQTGGGLFDGIVLDNARVVASDGFTHEVVDCVRWK